MPLEPAAGAVAGPVGAVTHAVGSAVGGAVGSVASSVAGSVTIAAVSAFLGAVGQAVASGAVWLLGEVAQAMSASTSVDLSSRWFSDHESVMVTLAAAVVLPMVCCVTIQALYHQSASMLVRAFLVQLPLALVFTGVAVELVQMALSVTDTLSAQLLAGAGVNTTNLLAPVSSFLVGVGPFAAGIPIFVVVIGGLLVATAALGLWLELVVRAAAVSVATLFLPLALAAMVWPAVAHWCRRLADTLVALVLSKLVIAAVLSLAIGAVAGGLDVGAGGANGGGFAAVVSGIALLFLATVSPFTLLRLIPAFEAGAVSHLESARHRLAAPAIEVRNLALERAQAAQEGEAKGDGRGTVAGSVATVVLVSAASPMSAPVTQGWNDAGGSATSGADGADTAAPARGHGQDSGRHDSGNGGAPARGGDRS